MGRLKCDHIKRLILLTSGNIKRLSLSLDSSSDKVKKAESQMMVKFIPSASGTP